MNTHEMDMTTGSLWKKIFVFSIPLMFSNLLQVFFNMADVAVIGRFVGAIALGAVGSTTIIVTLTTGILLGMASIISQYISAFLVLKFLLQCKQDYGLRIREISFDRAIAGQILKISVPSAVQYSLFAVANLCIQTAVNSFDHVIVEGNSAASNADTLVYDMMAAFYTACTSFIAQNLGAGKKKRIWHSYLITTLYSFLVGLILGLCIFILQKPFLSLFTSDPDVMKYARVRISIMGLCYCVSAFMDNATAAARGLGKSIEPTLIVILGSVVFRVIWIYTVFAYFHTLQSLYLVYVSAWILTAICGNLFFIHHYRKLQTAP